jgi:hypothetical protein
MWGQPPSAVQRAKPARLIADITSEGTMSTRHSIWLGESQGKSVHIYWELAEREVEDRTRMRVPIYIAVDGGNVDEEVVVRLPKEIAMRLLMVLVPNWADEVGRVL